MAPTGNSATLFRAMPNLRFSFSDNRNLYTTHQSCDGLMLSPAELHFLKTNLKLDGGTPTQRHKSVLENRIKKKVEKFREQIDVLQRAGYDLHILPTEKKEIELLPDWGEEE